MLNIFRSFVRKKLENTSIEQDTGRNIETQFIAGRIFYFIIHASGKRSTKFIL